MNFGALTRFAGERLQGMASSAYNAAATFNPLKGVRGVSEILWGR